MTQEQKAKAYDKALERAKEFYILCKKCGAKDTVDFLENTFSELKESEDERIRKALVRFHKSTIDVDGIKGEDIIAWLEKQGTSYTKRDVDDAFVEGMAFAKYELEKQGKQILANSAKTCKDEQKPAWSEEDEAHINSIIDYLLDYKLLVYEEDMNVANGVQKELDWLKSLQRIGG